MSEVILVNENDEQLGVMDKMEAQSFADLVGMARDLDVTAQAH